MILHNLETEFRKVFPEYYTTAVAHEGNLIVSIKSYSEPIQFTYKMITQVAELFETTDFEIQNKFNEGRWYSDVTKDSDDFELLFIKKL